MEFIIVGGLVLLALAGFAYLAILAKGMSR